jgi:lysophospholipase L1-like esterase
LVAEAAVTISRKCCPVETPVLNDSVKSGKKVKMRFMKYLLTKLIILSLLIVSIGCGHHPRIQHVTASSVVLAFGDSLTAGMTDNAAESYPAILAKMLGCRVVNAGIPGEETGAALARLPQVLEKEKPDLVIICSGGNDMLAKQEDVVIRDNLDAMVALAKHAGVDVIIIGVPRPRIRLEAPSFYQKIADKYGTPYDIEIIATILSKSSLKMDPIHPNAAGNNKLAERIAGLIQESAK